MNALKQVIDYVKEDGEFSKCQEQVDMAIAAEKELRELRKELAQLRAAQPTLAPDGAGVCAKCGTRSVLWVCRVCGHDNRPAGKA